MDIISNPVLIGFTNIAKTCCKGLPIVANSYWILGGHIGCICKFPFSLNKGKFSFDNMEAIFYIASVSKLQLIFNGHIFNSLFCLVDGESVRNSSRVVSVYMTSLL